MSFAISGALQKAVYAALMQDAELQSVVAGAIFDGVPQGQKPEIYVSLGPETVKSRSDASAGGAVHDFVISVVSEGGGFAGLKQVAGFVSESLSGADLALERGVLVYLRFLKAAAKRIRGSGGRQIDLTFRARVDDI